MQLPLTYNFRQVEPFSFSALIPVPFGSICCLRPSVVVLLRLVQALETCLCANPLLPLVWLEFSYRIYEFVWIWIDFDFDMWDVAGCWFRWWIAAVCRVWVWTWCGVAVGACVCDGFERYGICGLMIGVESDLMGCSVCIGLVGYCVTGCGSIWMFLLEWWCWFVFGVQVSMNGMFLAFLWIGFWLCF